MTTIIIIIYNYIFCVYDVGVKWFARIVHDLLRILLLHFLFTLSSPREGKSLCTEFGFSFKVCVHVINHVGAIIYKLNPFFSSKGRFWCILSKFFPKVFFNSIRLKYFVNKWIMVGVKFLCGLRYNNLISTSYNLYVSNINKCRIATKTQNVT